MKVIIYKDLVKVLTDLHLFNPDVVNISADEYTSCFGVPIIEAEPVRHGEWIEKINEETGETEYFCSNCRCVFTNKMFFCGFCGNKMV